MASNEPAAGMFCQELPSTYIQRKGNVRDHCPYPVRYVALWTGWTRFVCGYHKRRYVRVETLEEWKQKRL